MSFWKSVNHRPSLEDLLSRAWYDDLLYSRGYSAGYFAAMSYEHQSREWIRNGGNGPMPVYTAGTCRSPWKRLVKHYERVWKQGEAD